MSACAFELARVSERPPRPHRMGLNSVRSAEDILSMCGAETTSHVDPRPYLKGRIREELGKN